MAVLQLLRVDIGRRKCGICLTNIGSDDVVANVCRSQAPNYVSLEQVEDPAKNPAESSVFTSRFKHSAGDLGCCLPVLKVNIGCRRDSGEGLCVCKCTACEPDVSRRVCKRCPCTGEEELVYRPVSTFVCTFGSQSRVHVHARSLYCTQASLTSAVRQMQLQQGRLRGGGW
ncbi:hypothetical protein C0Q70_18144 [Pomacea canaliculata]|uniref:Uncharacterized protein n=1 Tax=Pomacea canaliculata TaxID=400727 RepID=A0A2T7NME2_POMCA|nr:hypothetical protein C0Q70_18144 [Pomacea canaliculata]